MYIKNKNYIVLSIPVWRFPLFLSLPLPSTRNCNTYAQVLVGDAVQKLNGTVRLHDARHHRLPDGIPALPDGHPDLSDLHRELLVPQPKDTAQVGRQRCYDQSGAEATPVQPRPTAAARGDGRVHAGKVW